MADTTTAAVKEPGSGAFAYERVLSENDCRVLERAEKLLEGLNFLVYVWVRDARKFGHGRDSDVPVFQLRLHPSLPVAEIRDMIQEQFEKLSSYRTRVDGPLQLLFDGRMLQNGDLLAEYITRHDRAPADNAAHTNPGKTIKHTQVRSWPKPFAGIIWVVPFRQERRPVDIRWGNGSSYS